MTKLTLSAIVSAFASAFITDKRNDNTEFVRLADESPEWMKDAVRSAHGGMMPDDVKYKMIAECASQLIDCMDQDDDDFDSLDTCEMSDNLVDIYNNDRLHWLSSSLYRAEYCDDAQNDGLVSDNTDMFTRIGMGQYMEYSEILHSVMSSLQAVYDEQEGDESE